ncbi:hypothetical protein L1987_81722 [Smallanthus sonchifolius]|uniref:Uncharacterized protein n=1 Tax=Smallanthus sonchifolius TaxID=185202 RepID=A0ACB8YSC6_9ASTR|nr:hypothetical protein L1987_81722 [Smallanthus sonchifolius]
MAITQGVRFTHRKQRSRRQSGSSERSACFVLVFTVSNRTFISHQLNTTSHRQKKSLRTCKAPIPATIKGLDQGQIQQARVCDSRPQSHELVADAMGHQQVS